MRFFYLSTCSRCGRVRLWCRFLAVARGNRAFLGAWRHWLDPAGWYE